MCTGALVNYDAICKQSGSTGGLARDEDRGSVYGYTCTLCAISQGTSSRPYRLARTSRVVRDAAQSDYLWQQQFEARWGATAAARVAGRARWERVKTARHFHQCISLY